MDLTSRRVDLGSRRVDLTSRRVDLTSRRVDLTSRLLGAGSVISPTPLRERAFFRARISILSQFGRSTPARVGAVEGGLWVAQGGPDVASVLSWKCISPTPTRERASVRPLQVVPGLRAPRDVRGQRWTLGRARVDLRTRGRRMSCDHALLGGRPRVMDRVRGAASRVDLTSRVAPDGKCVLPSPQGVELGSRRVDRRSRFEPADPNERRAGHGGPQVAVAGAASTPMRWQH